MNAQSSAALAMGWVDDRRPACRLVCAYCSTEAEFPHAASYWHGGQVLALHRCVSCGSLIYDLRGIDAPVVSATDAMSPAAARAARYVLETGFSAYYVAMCGLAAIACVAAQELPQCLFVDVGAGMGMASFFAKSVAGVETLTVEPSYTGKLAQEILGLEVHRAYFEALPAEVMARLSGRICVLHLNSVVEHLIDPYAVLQDMMGRAAIEAVAMIVPDGAALDFAGPFATALPFLAPRDHRHLPTARGVELLLNRLGFGHHHVQASGALLIGVGARRPFTPPAEITIKFGESLLLEHMLRHPHPQIAGGGAARLLAQAVLHKDQPLMQLLRQRLPYEAERTRLKHAVAARDWDQLPYHLGPACYWLAYDAYAAGRAEAALELLTLTAAFADAMAAEHPDFAMTALDFKWAGLLLRGHIESQIGWRAAAQDSLQMILQSSSDRQNGAGKAYLDQAKRDLENLYAAALDDEDDEIAPELIAHPEQTPQEHFASWTR
jgi:hypothetical protein